MVFLPKKDLILRTIDISSIYGIEDICQLNDNNLAKKTVCKEIIKYYQNELVKVKNLDSAEINVLSKFYNLIPLSYKKEYENENTNFKIINSQNEVLSIIVDILAKIGKKNNSTGIKEMQKLCKNYNPQRSVVELLELLKNIASKRLFGANNFYANLSFFGTGRDPNVNTFYKLLNGLNIADKVLGIKPFKKLKLELDGVSRESSLYKGGKISFD